MSGWVPEQMNKDTRARDREARGNVFDSEARAISFRSKSNWLVSVGQTARLDKGLLPIQGSSMGDYSTGDSSKYYLS